MTHVDRMFKDSVLRQGEHAAAGSQGRQRGSTPASIRVRLRTYVVGALWLCASSGGIAETVYVKYRGPVDLKTFSCEWIDRSSLVKRLCYDAKEKYVVVNLTGTYYHYCEVPRTVVAAWREAESMGKFFNAQVKGQFDCRVFRVPPYTK